MPKLIPDSKQFEEGFENFKKDVTVSTGKTVSGVANEFVRELYAPSTKDQRDSGETASFSEQLTPKPGEMFGDIAGSPPEPGQGEQTVSALGQVSIPVDKLTNTMIGSQIEPGENPPSEEPFEQLLPSASQLVGHATGSVPSQKVTPHMETTGQQIIPSIEELTGLVGIPSSEASGIPSQRPGTMQHPAEQDPAAAAQGQPPEVQQMIQQQQEQKAEMGPVDSTMQMSAEERTKLDAVQKELREHRMLHDYTYIRGPLDTSPTILQELAKKQQETKQVEEQKKQEEEEEEQRKKEEEERKKQEELPEPGKDKPTENIAVSQSQKKTEMHRGAAG